MLITIWTSSSTKRLANWECAAVNFNVCNMKSKHKIKFEGKLRKLNICLNYMEEINYINMFRKKKKKKNTLCDHTVLLVVKCSHAVLQSLEVPSM